MNITINIDEESLAEVMTITNIKKKGPAITHAVQEFIKRHKSRQFAQMIRENAFDYPAPNDEIEEQAS